MVSQRKIGVFGSSSGQLKEAGLQKAAEIGRLLAERGYAVVTGATIGIPHEAVKAAHAAGGVTIGYSSVTSREEQVKLGWPADEHTELHFVPTSYELAGERLARLKYRNISSTYAADAGIIISGQYGTLNEFTLLYDFQKPIAVLTGTGGFADLLADMTSKVVKEPHPPIVFSSDPAELLDLLEAHLSS